MTRNPKQCENAVLCRKYTEKLFKKFEKENGDSIKIDDPRENDKYWEKWHKEEHESLKIFCKTKGIKKCSSTDALVRIYIRKTAYKNGTNKTYQKLEPFGWYCPNCKNIEIDPKIIGQKFPFHSTWTTKDLENAHKSRFA